VPDAALCLAGLAFAGLGPVGLLPGDLARLLGLLVLFTLLGRMGDQP